MQNTEDDVPEPSRDARSSKVSSSLTDVLAARAKQTHEALAVRGSIHSKGSHSESSYMSRCSSSLFYFTS